MPENPLLQHIVTGPAQRAAKVPRPPVVREGVVQTGGALLLAGDEEPLPNLIPHAFAAGTRVAVIHANNRIYMLGAVS